MFRTLLLVTLIASCGGNDQNGKTVPGGDGGSNTPDAFVDPSCATPGVFPTLKSQLVVKAGLTKPVYLAQPTGSTDLYVVEEGGTIRIVRNGTALATPFLTISDTQLPANGEGGLLSIAFHKDYAQNGRFFTYGTVTGDNQAVVREYHRSSNPDVADPTIVAELVKQPNDGNANVGGTIAFGNDGLLYVSAGDGGDPPEAQDLTSRRGKILRVDVDSPGTAPAGNMPGGDAFLWDSGLRNVYRMSFDRKTHELYLADAGDAKFEEVDIEQPGMGHLNYGWDTMEGKVCNNPSSGCNMTGLTLPQYVRPHQVDFSVIIGGSVYRGPAIPCLSGYYVFGIYGTTSHILTWQWDGTNVSPEKDISDVVPDAMDPVAINEDAAGELYVVTLTNGIFKIIPG
ncbi:MAG: PQQ-dependent sugar dehydrogenase [Kofleriaceae bacterium]